MSIYVHVYHELSVMHAL